MKLIAHRGLYNGPDKELENSPDQIIDALSRGYDCEVDLWIINSEMWLGHDGPEYYIQPKFLFDNATGLWIHAKNLAALRWLTDQPDLVYFTHNKDECTLTSNNLIWTYPGKDLTMKSIMLMPEWADPDLKNVHKRCYGICSDYVAEIKEILFPSTKL